MYNYGGYNNITYLGAEVKNPARNIPRAIVFSVLLVAVLYLFMSVVIIGTVPWRDAAVSHAVVSEFISKLYGSRAAALMTALILAATLGGIFTMTLGYSRILYAAGAEGNFFKVFGRVHPSGHFPTVSLIAISVMAVPLCWLSLEKLLSALMDQLLILKPLSSKLRPQFLKTCTLSLQLSFSGKPQSGFLLNIRPLVLTCHGVTVQHPWCGSTMKRRNTLALQGSLGKVLRTLVGMSHLMEGNGWNPGTWKVEPPR